MEADAVLGCLVLVATLVAITALVIWSRMSIDRIAEKNLRSVREIVRGLGNGR